MNAVLTIVTAIVLIAPPVPGTLAASLSKSTFFLLIMCSTTTSSTSSGISSTCNSRGICKLIMLEK